MNRDTPKMSEKRRYSVIEKIGSGGMAEVFKGKIITIKGYERLVALKRIHPSLLTQSLFKQMFLDEARLALNLVHGNIVQVFDLEESSNTYFMVMEYVEGINLKHAQELLCNEGSRWRVEEAVYVIMQICKALHYAHTLKGQDGQQFGVVHRDVSPPNILLSVHGEVKLTDFGLAKARDHLEETDPGIVKGKFSYLSPEAARGEEVDQRADLFACGATLWELLSGVRLFDGETDYETLKLVRKADIPPLADYSDEIPSKLEEICRSALMSDPKSRIQDAMTLGRSLSEFLYSHEAQINQFTFALKVNELLRIKQELEDRARENKKSESGLEENGEVTTTDQSTGLHEDAPTQGEGEERRIIEEIEETSRIDPSGNESIFSVYDKVSESTSSYRSSESGSRKMSPSPYALMITLTVLGLMAISGGLLFYLLIH
jgi:serine/threonine-protein kinase